MRMFETEDSSAYAISLLRPVLRYLLQLLVSYPAVRLRARPFRGAFF
jgi:hypothetical protein